MTKVKALNKDGKITWCTAKVPGHGNCNHVMHQINGMTDDEFQKSVDEYNEKLAKETAESCNNSSTYDKLVEDMLNDYSVYQAVGGDEELFRKAKYNIENNDDEVLSANTREELDKKIYDFYQDTIEDAIIDKLDNGEDCEYGRVIEHAGGRDVPDDYEYKVSFKPSDVENILEDDSIVSNMKLNITKADDGKYYAVNIY